MPATFTWIPLYEELATRLVAWEDRQDELVAFLEGLRAQDLKITPLSDRDASGARFLLREIDPFTFLGVFNRNIRDEYRHAIVAAVKRFFDLESPLPTDFNGVPLLNNQKSWFVGYQHERQPGDVPALWRVFKAALAPEAPTSQEFRQAFDEALRVRNTNFNLTIGLFWIRPHLYVSLEKTNRQVFNIIPPPTGLSASFYTQTLERIRELGRPIPELSLEAWEKSRNQPRAATFKIPDAEQGIDYWMVSALWPDQDPADQSGRFISEGIWEADLAAHYEDKVRAMRVGDRIAIKTAAVIKSDLPFDARGHRVSRMTIEAVGTVVANRSDGRTVEVEWDPAFTPRDWYFYTQVGRDTIWRLRKVDPLAQKLIAFAFYGADQDYAWFCHRWFDGTDPATDTSTDEQPSSNAYGVANMLDDGVFLTEEEIGSALERLRSKKNLILQGPPGVGKTFVARKLAYAMLGARDDERIEMVQFHQAYAYEDFIRGYRPSHKQAGAFELQDGIFFAFCQRAAADPTRDYVFIIDEINRGNLAQIFGELLMLLEADKRGPRYAVPLVYRKPEEARFYVPANLYVIGLMNVADRSLAMVDYAMRRRFAFLSLEPRFASQQFQRWLQDREMADDLIQRIVDRLEALNQKIAGDTLLGPHYQVGHSFFCPKGDRFAELDRRWYESVVKTEIAPLLEEYWFDNRDQAAAQTAALLA